MKKLSNFYTRVLGWLGIEGSVKSNILHQPSHQKILQYFKELLFSNQAKNSSRTNFGLWLIFVAISALICSWNSWPEFFALAAISFWLVFAVPQLWREAVQKNKYTPKKFKMSKKLLRQFVRENGFKYGSAGKYHWLRGLYKGYNFEIEINEIHKSVTVSCSPLNNDTGQEKNDLSNKTVQFDQKLTVDNFIKLFTENLHNPLPYSITFQADGRNLRCFYKKQLHDTFLELQTIVDTLSKFADSYAACCDIILDMGGDAIPVLLEILSQKRHKLQPTAHYLLTEIAKNSTKLLQEEMNTLLCPKCLVYSTSNQIELPQDTITYYGCRSCYRTTGFENLANKQLIAVLDQRPKTKISEDDTTIRVNWLTHRKLFDFESIEIVDTSDEEVERFAVQVGNDTDPVRANRYQEMPCFISSACTLSENSLRILQRMFGKIEVVKPVPKDSTRLTASQNRDKFEQRYLKGL